MTRIGLLALAITAAFSSVTPAGAPAPPADESFQAEESWFLPYEPTKLAFTNDDDDATFLDVSISIKYPLRWAAGRLNDNAGNITHDPFIAFTGRFGFYWLGGRESAPVIGKRFNPVFGWRFVRRTPTGAFTCPDQEAEELQDQNVSRTPAAKRTFVPAPAVGNRKTACVEVLRESYLQLAYAHESNGQSIQSPEGYAAAVLAAVARDQDPYTANDALSRGWDYLGLTWKPACSGCESDRFLWSNYLQLRYFLDHGLLQKDAEEVNDWEPLAAQGKPRSQVNGIALLSKVQAHSCMDAIGQVCKRWLGDLKFVLGYETGHKKLFKHNTFRAEVGAHLWGLPVTLWWQDGYANDLALYYVRGTTFGIGLDIGSF